MTLYLAISLRVIGGGPGLVYPQKSAHLKDEITSKVLSLVRMQHIEAPNFSTQFSTISRATSAKSVDTSGTATAFLVNRSVLTKICFALVRVASVTGPKMSAATVYAEPNPHFKWDQPSNSFPSTSATCCTC